MLDSKRISKVSIRNFLFHCNGIGPSSIVARSSERRLSLGRGPECAAGRVGILVAGAGQLLRVVTIGYDYSERSGENRRVPSKLVRGGMFNHCATAVRGKP
jgi:hypothetical protein